MSYTATLGVIALIVCSHALIGWMGFLLGRRVGMLVEHREADIQNEVLEWVVDEALTTPPDVGPTTANSSRAGGPDDLDRA